MADKDVNRGRAGLDPRTVALGAEAGALPLPAGTVLQDRFVIRSVLGRGGFGVTYMADHKGLDRRVALKEHFPEQFAVREGLSVRATASGAQMFKWGLDRFLEEAKRLARFKHPSIVDVTDVFEANGTAYMALAYEEGETLGQWLDRMGSPSQAELDRLLAPILDALEHVHGHGILHRDIAPDNIMLRLDGTPVLIDFGAARQAMAERSHTLTGIVKHGYSPPEQYTRSSARHGPWSDIYALGATLYRALTGESPQEATDRQLGDAVQDLRGLASKGYRPGFLAAVMQALALQPGDRPQSIAQWRPALLSSSRPLVSARPGTSALPANGPSSGPPPRATSGPRPLPSSRPGSQHQPPQQPSERQPSGLIKPAPPSRAPWAMIGALFVVMSILSGGGWFAYTTYRTEEARRLADVRREIAAATTSETLDRLSSREPKAAPEIAKRREELATIARSERLKLLREQIARESSTDNLDRIANEAPELRPEAERRKAELAAEAKAARLRLVRERIAVTDAAVELDRIAAEEPEVRVDVEARKLALVRAARERRVQVLRERIPATTDEAELDRIAAEAPELATAARTRKAELARLRADEEVRRRAEADAQRQRQRQAEEEARRQAEQVRLARVQALRERIPATSDPAELDSIAQEAPELASAAQARKRDLEEARRRGPIEPQPVTLKNEIRWRLAGAYPQSFNEVWRHQEALASGLSARTGQKFSLQIFPAGAIVPSFGLLDAVRNGTIEAGLAPATFWIGKAFAFELVAGQLPHGMDIERFLAWAQGPGAALREKVYAQQNVRAIPCVAIGSSGLWTKKQIRVAGDLKGLKIRASSSTASILSKLGANTVILHLGELIPALERGIIDGMVTEPLSYDPRLGFNKVAKHYTHRVFDRDFSTVVDLIVGASAWNNLPAEARQLLAQSCAYELARSIDALAADTKASLATSAIEGFTSQVPSPELSNALRREADAFLDEKARSDPLLAEVWASLRAARNANSSVPNEDASRPTEVERQRQAVLDAERQRQRQTEEEARKRAEEARRRDPALAVTPGSGQSFRDCPTCPAMVVVPAGRFTMGSPANEPERNGNESPQREVTILRPFAVGKFEVTFAEWDACRAEGVCNHNPANEGWGRGKQPVINVSWDDAKQYVTWLSHKTGKTYRLPSEAEWEYAARAGTTTPFWWGSSITAGQANYDGNHIYKGGGAKGNFRRRTMPVDSFAANSWGLHNVHGNVWEWVEDCWLDSYSGASTYGGARTTSCTDGNRRVLRGGSWDSLPDRLRAAARFGYSAVYQSEKNGFRIARTLDTPSGLPADATLPTPNDDARRRAEAERQRQRQTEEEARKRAEEEVQRPRTSAQPSPGSGFPIEMDGCAFKSANRGKKTVAIVASDTPSAKSAVAAVRALAQANGFSIVADVSLSDKAIDFSATLVKLRSASPGVIFVCATYAHSFLQQAQAIGLTR